MTKSEFTEIEVIRDPEGLGLIASITMREKANGYVAFSFAIFKEFERSVGGATQRTSYMNDRHIEAARKLLDHVERRISEEKDKLHARRRRNNDR